MVHTLDQFVDRLKKLEDTIIPVHRQTKDLQWPQENVERTKTALDDDISYHQVAQKVQPVINKPISSNISQYISSMKKLQGATHFFSLNKPGSLELRNVTQLFNKGNETLEHDFKVCLNRHTSPCTAAVLLDLSKTEIQEMKTADFIPDKAVKSLSEIARWLTSVDRNTQYITGYSNSRRKHVMDSLETIYSHTKSLSSDSLKKSFTLTATPKQSAKSAKLRKMSTLMTKKEPSGGKNLMVPVDTIEELEIKPFTNMTLLILKLLYCEHKLMQMIIPANFHQQVFIDTIQGPLNKIETTFNKFIDYTRSCNEQKDHAAVMNVFPVADFLHSKQQSFKNILREADDHNKRRINRLLRQLHVCGKEVLMEFIDSVKSDPDSHMPKDGTVHELTSNTMMFVLQLAANSQVAGRMLASLTNPDTSNDPELAKYLVNVLSALNANLTNKTKAYEDDALKSVFILNNYNFIYSKLLPENLLVLLRSANPDVDNVYLGRIKSAKAGFMAKWNDVSMVLKQDEHFVISQIQGKLKDKERKAVKDKFSRFNSDFEFLVRKQQKWSVPDQDNREELRREVKEALRGPYEAMYKKYRMVPFATNITKYLKFTADDVNAEVDKLFSQSSS